MLKPFLFILQLSAVSLFNFNSIQPHRLFVPTIGMILVAICIFIIFNRRLRAPRFGVRVLLFILPSWATAGEHPPVLQRLVLPLDRLLIKIIAALFFVDMLVLFSLLFDELIVVPNIFLLQTLVLVELLNQLHESGGYFLVV